MYRGKEEDIPDISKELAKHPVVRIVEDVDCFAPRRVISIDYSGPNIREIVKQAPRVLRRGMMITGTRTYIDDYYVDVTDPNNIRFHIFWHGIRGWDDKSQMWGWIRLKQGLLKPDGTGSVRIEFFAKVITTWERDTFLKRIPLYDLLIWIYKYIYYDAERRKMIEQCKEWEQDMIRRMKELLKLMETATLPYP
jgi:hypothetical protein